MTSHRVPFVPGGLKAGSKNQFSTAMTEKPDPASSNVIDVNKLKLPTEATPTPLQQHSKEKSKQTNSPQFNPVNLKTDDECPSSDSDPEQELSEVDFERLLHRAGNQTGSRTEDLSIDSEPSISTPNTSAVTIIVEETNKLEHELTQSSAQFRETSSSMVAHTTSDQAVMIEDQEHAKPQPQQPKFTHAQSIGSYPFAEQVLITTPLETDDIEAEFERAQQVPSALEQRYGLMTFDEWQQTGQDLADRAADIIKKAVMVRLEKAKAIAGLEQTVDAHANVLEKRYQGLMQEKEKIRKRAESLVSDASGMS
ncbi:hypothetical protein V1514DRAFT_193414 [Lipomyces japonicus]|uniref:uncharacterized protein n=1 Tax=Lipomyces japonicus TaxID=56871 RepID=UPI0034CF046A